MFAENSLIKNIFEERKTFDRELPKKAQCSRNQAIKNGLKLFFDQNFAGKKKIKPNTRQK